MTSTEAHDSQDRQTPALLEARRREILAQPNAMKEVYGPDQDTVNPHTIVRGPDAWHLFYGAFPGRQNLD